MGAPAVYAWHMHGLNYTHVYLTGITLAKAMAMAMAMWEPTEYLYETSPTYVHPLYT